MSHGRLPRLLPVASLFGLLFFGLLLALTAPAVARPAPASDLSGTLLTVGDAQVTVQTGDGHTVAAAVTRATWTLRRGLVVSIREFTPGEAVHLRLGRGRAGTRPAALLCDPETAALLAAWHGRLLTGTLLASEGSVWTVQPPGAAFPLPVCLSPRTVYRAGTANTGTGEAGTVGAEAFAAGAAVTITTRGLANGLLAAVSVAAAPVAAGDEGSREPDAPPRPASLSGVLLDVRPDLGLLTVTDAAGAAHTVALGAGTRVRVGGRAALDALTPGLRVRVRLAAGQDAAGHPVAVSVSASAAAARQRKGK